jgi:hypothetical protein
VSTSVAETDERFYAAPSAISGAGEGLFARVPLRTGDRLRVIGVVIPRDSVSDTCTSFADSYKLRIGNALLIPVGWAAKVNHSDDPNVAKTIEDGEMYLEAIRPIAIDEEIVFRYHDYARGRLK